MNVNAVSHYLIACPFIQNDTEDTSDRLVVLFRPKHPQSIQFESAVRSVDSSVDLSLSLCHSGGQFATWVPVHLNLSMSNRIISVC